MYSKWGPKEGHCKETYKYSIKRVKYARYMRTNFRSLQFFIVKRLFSPFASRVLDTPWHSCTQNADQKKVTAKKHTGTASRGSNMPVICGPNLGLCNFLQWKGYFHILKEESRVLDTPGSLKCKFLKQKHHLLHALSIYQQSVIQYKAKCFGKFSVESCRHFYA